MNARSTIALLTCASAATSALAAPPAYQQLVLNDQPALYYKFNEAPGSTQIINYGSFGTTFNMNVAGTPALNTPSASGDTGITFDGTPNQFLSTTAQAPLAYTGDPGFTIEAVVRVVANNANVGYPIFLHWGAPTTGRSVYFGPHHLSPRRMYAGFYNGGLRASCESPLSRWMHVVWVHPAGDGQWGTGNKLYVNGVLVNTEPDTILIGAPTINVAQSIFYVNKGTDFSRFFQGSMDELVLYSSQLTATQVSQRFAALNLPKCLADIRPLGGSALCGADGQVTADDLVAYLSAFFAGNTAVADVASLGGALAPDGRITADDLIAYLGAFFAGCQ